MPSEQDRAPDRVLRTIRSSTADAQRESISKGTLYFQCVGHADMEPDQVDQAIHQLVRTEKIRVDNGEYRLADGIERPTSRGGQ